MFSLCCVLRKRKGAKVQRAGQAEVSLTEVASGNVAVLPEQS